MRKYVFLDTNVFEQFQPITDIDWLNLTQGERVTLLVASVTVRELNEHKDGAKRGRLRNKAAATLVQLKKYADQGLPVQLRDGVELNFRPQEPRIDFEAHRLDPKLADDRLIATAIAFVAEEQVASQRVLVASGDFGLELKIKDQNHIGVLPLPEALRLPAELDDDEKQIRNLQSRIRELESAAPDIILTFNDDRSYAAVEIGLHRDEEQIEPDEIIRQERSKRPFLQGRVPQAINGWQFTRLAAPEDLDKYNEELDAYFQKLAKWLHAERSLREWFLTTAKLDFKVTNKGGAPGTSMHIDLHFPDGFGVLSENELPKTPTRPEPPAMPHERIAAALSSFNIGPSFDHYRSPSFDIGQPQNAWLSSVKKTNSYVVRFEVKSLKHTLSEVLPSVYIHFENATEARGFQIDYNVVAGNHPFPFKGELNVEVLKS